MTIWIFHLSSTQNTAQVEMFCSIFFYSRDLSPVECLDAAEGDAKGIPLDEGHADVAVVEEARLVLQDVLRQQLRQLKEEIGFRLIGIA